ncbi:hypothetical protein H0H93_014669, partial [Arthromyces matolae]
MKALLITTYILLVIASPIPREASLPQSTSYGDDIKKLSIASGTGDSGTLEPRGNSAANSLFGAPSTLPKAGTEGPHSHHNQPVDKQTALKHAPYIFGTIVNGEDITQELGKPKRLPKLAPLPEDLDTWDLEILKDIATGIVGRFEHVIRSIRNDRNAISRAISYLLDGNEEHLKSWPSRGRAVVVPKIRALEREELVGVIINSDAQLRREISWRNKCLKDLSKVAQSKIIPDRLHVNHVNNVYATWRLNLIQLSKDGFEPESDTSYSFTTAWDGNDLTHGIGLPKKISIVAPLPTDLDEWGTATLRE